MSEQKDTTLWDLIKSGCRWLGRCFNYAIDVFNKQLKITFRKWYVVIPVTIIGIVLGFWFSRIENRKYRAEGMAVVHGPMAAEIKEVVRPLAVSMPQNINSGMSMAEVLNCSPEITRGITQFRTIYVIDYLDNFTPDLVDYKGKHQLEDTLNLVSNNYIVFELYTKDLSQLRNFEHALVDYINNNPMMQTKYQYHRQMLEYELDVCDKQLNYLDSLTKVFYFSYPQGMQFDLESDPNKRSSLILGNRSIKTLHEDIISLIQHKRDLEADLSSCTQPLVFISHISAVPKAVNNRIASLILGLLCGWVLGLCIAWLIEDRKRVYQWLTTK